MKAFLPSEKLERVFSSGFDSGVLFVAGCTLVSCIFLAGIFLGWGTQLRPDMLALLVVVVLGVAWGVLVWLKMRAESRSRKVAEILAAGRVKSEATEDGMICLKADTTRNFDLGAGTQRINATITAKISLSELEKLQSVIDASNRSTVLALPSGDHSRGPVVDVEDHRETRNS